MGSWVSLSAAARDRRVGAVVENSGGLPLWEDFNPARLPPVLILHGDADRVVPVGEAHRLDRVLQEAGVPHEVHIYPGAGHSFVGPDAEDALARTLAFLDAHLKQSPRAARRAGDRDR
jgi:carboxymethylenebutenolidase